MRKIEKIRTFYMGKCGEKKMFNFLGHRIQNIFQSLRFLIGFIAVFLQIFIECEATTATCFCIKDHNEYLCHSFSANITSENDPLVIDAFHQPGFGYKDVKNL